MSTTRPNSIQTENGLGRMVNVFHHQGISNYLDGEDVIRLLQCGSTRLNRTLRREAVALRFAEWHTRFTNMFRLFRFLAEYFPNMNTLKLDVWCTHGFTSLSHEIETSDPTTNELDALKHVRFPNLTRIIVREEKDNLAATNLARFFNSMAHATSDIFPILRTLHISCSSTVRYDANVSAFVHYTPASVTRLKLEIIAFTRAVTDFDIQDARSNKPVLSLESLSLKLRTTPRWGILASAYNMNDLVKLVLHLPVGAELDTAILPRSLRHLDIGTGGHLINAWHSLTNPPKRSIIHIKNAPAYLESMTLYNVDVMMHEHLPPMLQQFILNRVTVRDDDKFIVIASLPRNLKQVHIRLIHHQNSMVAMDHYLFSELMNRPREEVESAIKQWPARLLFIVDTFIADWLCSYAHMPEIGLFVTHSHSYDSYYSIHQYALTKDDGIDIARRETLAALAAIASQTNPLLKAVAQSPSHKPIENVIETGALADVDVMTIRENESYFILHGELDMTRFVLQYPNNMVDIVSVCARMRHLDIEVDAYQNMDAILSCLPRSLRTLAISFAQSSKPSRFNILLLNSDMRIRHLELRGLSLDPVSLTQFVDTIKSVPTCDQLVLTVSIMTTNIHGQHIIRAHTVHCHSVHADTLSEFFK